MNEFKLRTVAIITASASNKVDIKLFQHPGFHAPGEKKPLNNQPKPGQPTAIVSVR